MARPSPLPLVVRDVSARVNLSKAWGRKSESITVAVVAHLDRDGCGVAAVGADGNGWAAVFGGVVEQVGHYAIEIIGIGPYP